MQGGIVAGPGGRGEQGEGEEGDQEGAHEAAQGSAAYGQPGSAAGRDGARSLADGPLEAPGDDVDRRVARVDEEVAGVRP